MSLPWRIYGRAHLMHGVLVVAAMLALAPVVLTADVDLDNSDLARSQQAVTAGHDGLEQVTTPWYDGQTDELKAITFREPINWWDMTSALTVIAWVVGIVLVLALVALLFFVLRHSMPHSLPQVTSKATTELQADQVEALAFLAKRPRDDLLGQARMHYYQGNYAEAIIYLFSHELVELDKASLVRLAQGKTNRQYMREVARVEPLKRLVETTMTTFEDVFFGQRPLDRAGFERCWNELPQFEALLRTDS